MNKICEQKISRKELYEFYIFKHIGFNKLLGQVLNFQIYWKNSFRIELDMKAFEANSTFP